MSKHDDTTITVSIRLPKTLGYRFRRAVAARQKTDPLATMASILIPAFAAIAAEVEDDSPFELVSGSRSKDPEKTRERNLRDLASLKRRYGRAAR